jgi:hypothetical protein
MVLATILAICAPRIPSSRAQNQAKDKSGEDFTALRDALRRDGLRGAAKLKGNYVASFDPHFDFWLFSIETLTKNSSAIIVGKPQKRLDSRLSKDGGTIYTDYEVAVEEAMKGLAKDVKTVVVRLPGGRVYFADGTSAEILTPHFEDVRIGDLYTFFLTKVDQYPDGFDLVGGATGLVEIQDSSRVKSRGQEADPILIETKDEGRDSFLRQVREQTQKWPAPGKCCH